MFSCLLLLHPLEQKVFYVEEAWTHSPLRNLKSCRCSLLAITASRCCLRRALKRYALNSHNQVLLSHVIVGSSVSLPLKVPGFDEILVETINLCCHYYENHMYVMPKEKYILLKVSHHVLYTLLKVHVGLVLIFKIIMLNLLYC